LLELNDSTFQTLRESQTAGTMRLGLQEDFGVHFLSEILRLESNSGSFAEE